MTKRARQFFEFGPFRIYPSERLLSRRNQAVPLKPKVFDLLMTLVQNSGHALKKDELMREVWPDSFVEEGNLVVSISALRKALGEDREHHYIETIPRYGYRFTAGVREMRDEASGTLSEMNGLPETVIENGIGGGLKSLAVLPFNQIGASAHDDYLGLGIADALITRLSNLTQLAVRPTSAVRKYNSGMQDPVEAGRELKVEVVLDGSVRRAGERIRVTVQMVSVEEGRSLWADMFDEQFTNIFAVEDSISEQVVKALTIKLGSDDKKLLAKRYTENTEAYLAYLKGRYLVDKRTVEGFNKAVKCFERAIELDSNYALAYAELAGCLLEHGNYNSLPPREFIPKAKEAALKALELDETLAEAQAYLGRIMTFEWDWAGSERAYTKAIELNPNSATAHKEYALYLRLVGRFDEAIAEIKRAQELDPISLTISSTLGSCFYLARRYDEAIDRLLEVIDLDSNYLGAHFNLALVYIQMKMHEEAIAEFQKVISLSGIDSDLLAHLGYIHAVTGRRKDAQKVIVELRRMSEQSYISPYCIGLIYTGLGEYDLAFECLEKAYQEHDYQLAALKVYPLLDGLRADPRFASLLKRVGFQSDNA